MWQALRSKAVRQAGETLAGQSAGLLGHPAVQDVIARAASIRADLLDQLDERFSAVAKKLNLATRGEMKQLRRQIRELENQVSGLEHQLSSERQRADRAEGSLTEAMRAQKKAAQTDLADRSRLEAQQRELTEAKARAEAALRETEALKARLTAELAAAEASRATAPRSSEESEVEASADETPARKPGRRRKAEATEPPAAD